MDFFPKNEQGVIALFFMNIHKTKFELVSIKTSFPDATLLMNGDIYRTEFEYKSANFIKHNHNIQECDLVICWENNRELVVPTIEMSRPDWYNFDSKKLNLFDKAILEQKQQINELKNQLSELKIENRRLMRRMESSERKYGKLRRASNELTRYKTTLSKGYSYNEKMILLNEWVEKLQRFPTAKEISERWGVSQGTAYNYLREIEKFDLSFIKETGDS